MIKSTDFTFFIARKLIFRRALAKMHLIVKRVEQILHQVVALFTVKAILALSKSLVKMNVHTPLSFVEKVLWRSSEILKSVSIVTHRPIMLIFYLRTERRFITVDHELVKWEFFL